LCLGCHRWNDVAEETAGLGAAMSILAFLAQEKERKIQQVSYIHTLAIIFLQPESTRRQFSWVHERFLDAPRLFGENREEAGAIYCVFVTATHVDP